MAVLGFVDPAFALWAGLVLLVVLAGFLTGEWSAKYRELKEWARARREQRGGGSHFHLPPPRPHAS